MKKRNLLIIVTLFLGVFFSSCKKQTDLELEANKNIQASSSQNTNAARQNENNLTDEDVVFIGQKHNDVLSTVFRNYDFTNTDRLSELQAQFSINYPDNTVDWGNEAAINSYYYQNLKKAISSEAFSYVDRALELSNNLSNFESYSDSIDVLKTEAKEVLNGRELDCILVFLEVSKKSIEFWLPASMGGCGTGEEILNNFNSQQSQARLNWNKIFAADALSAGTQCLYVAFTGPAGLAGIGFFAAASSAYTAAGIP